ncbi:MAG: ABC transporter substrate-binding protein, partial [Clostridia bacterium]|nr:ABC transporter substrate-binding protein [Clostridia bacterium]
MKKSRITAIIALIVCCAFVVASCGTKTSTSSWDLAAKQIDIIKGTNPEKSPAVAKNRKDTLVIGSTDFNGIFNPLYAESAYDQAVVGLVFGMLIEPDFDAKPVPGLADFKISSDGLTYTFTIKKGVKFSDGTPMTAQDIEFTYYVLCDPSYDGPIDAASLGLVGYKDYVDGKADTISGIKVINDSTIEFKVDKVNAEAIWYFNAGVMSKAYYGKDFKKGNLDSLKTLHGQPMGAGPYKLAEFKLGESIHLVANDSFIKGAPKIKNVIYSVTPEGQELERVKLGEVDIDFPTVNEENITDAKDQGYIDVYRFPTNGYGYIGFKDDDPKYSDKRVRQALITALNRKAVVEAVYGPYANVINIPQSKVSWAYSDEGIKTYDYDLAKAEALLKEAGWTKNANGKLEKDGQVFKILFSCVQGHPVTDPMLPVMKDDYGKLGIDVEIEYVDFPTLIDKANNGTADMWFMAWGLTPDPNPYNVYGSDGPQ